jgi:hypothetical protein
MPEGRRKLGAATATFNRTIDAQSVQNYASALQLESPIYRDSEVARAGGYRDIPAPLGYVIGFTVVPRDAKFDAMEIDERKALAGEMSFDIRGPICAGDTLTGRCELVEIAKKGGPRPFTLLKCETSLRNQFGDTVLVVNDTTLEFDR